MIVSKCAICGGKVEEREVGEEVRIGNDFVVIENVIAGVCVECGERYYPPGVVDGLRDIEMRIMDRKKLKELDVIGRTYKMGFGATVWSGFG
jgi:YgiT-type zinc finger domain